MPAGGDGVGAMSRLLLVSAALLALVGGTAGAADLPIGAPVYAPPVFVPFTWNGFYLGLNLGGHWGNDRVSTTTDSGGAFTATGAASIDGASPGTLNPIGVTGGLQAGYNWQFNSVVAGIEADVNGSTGRLNRTVTIPPTVGIIPGDFLRNFVNQPTLLVTLRPRLGWAFDHGLVYVTGGYAFETLPVTDSFGFFNSVVVAQSTVTAKLSGWTAGAGLEYAVARGVSAKIEYLYVGLGSFTNTINNSQAVTPPSNIAVRHSYSDNIVRVGVNFHPTW
jgi:outer membrane immunogenic protein